MLIFFFFNDTATTEIYTLSLHDALPIFERVRRLRLRRRSERVRRYGRRRLFQDRKSTRLNSSHVEISYAVFCLKKKKIPISQNSNKITRMIISSSLWCIFKVLLSTNPRC